MTLKKKGLGRGLNDLGLDQLLSEFDQPQSIKGTALTMLSVDKLKQGKYQPRQDMHFEALQELADSIAEQGVIQPILARQTSATSPDEYEILAGERRWRAAKMAGLMEVPVVIRPVEDQTAMIMGLIENIQRENLNAMEEAQAFGRLLDEFGLTHEQIAKSVGRSRSAVSNILRLLGLPQELKTLLAHGDIEMGHARALLSFYVYMRYAIGLEPQDRYWNVADPGWAYGLYYAVVGPLLLGNTTHFNENAFTPETTYQMLSKYKITNLAAAPTAYRLLMAHENLLAEHSGFELRLASSAGEPLNPEVIGWVERRLGCPVMDHYGQTETGMTACNHHNLKQDIVRVGSMGFSLPGHRVVALDNDLNELQEGQIGELAVDMEKSPLFIFPGYTWGEKNPFRGKYYLTGDVVVSHGDGSYSFNGRDDDIITTAGYRVGPSDVENTLLEHEAVAESGVIGKPDLERGAIIKAYVVLREQFDPSDELIAELKTHVRSRLSTHAFPREIEFMQELPKTPSGKIQRFILRNRPKDEADGMS